MPMLLMILGRRIGLRMTLALAPLHVFVKYTDDRGRVWNLEATSGGGFTRDVWYRHKFSMTEAAVAKGTYLRSLPEDETAAVMASSLVEYLVKEKRPEEAIEAANVILRHYPAGARRCRPSTLRLRPWESLGSSGAAMC